MQQFIEVHFNGEKRLINLSWVEEIQDCGDCARIYFAFVCPGADEQDCIQTDESYAEILRKIWR